MEQKSLEVLMELMECNFVASHSSLLLWVVEFAWMDVYPPGPQALSSLWDGPPPSMSARLPSSSVEKRLVTSGGGGAKVAVL